MNCRSQPQTRAIDRPEHHVDDDDEIACVERQIQQALRIELRDDRQHADQRYGDPEELERPQAIAEQHVARDPDRSCPSASR